MIMMIILVLNVWNVDTGERLFHLQTDLPLAHNLDTDCRKEGAKEAKRLSREWTSQENPNVTTNFSCRWEKVNTE